MSMMAAPPPRSVALQGFLANSLARGANDTVLGEVNENFPTPPAGNNFFNLVWSEEPVRVDTLTFYATKSSNVGIYVYPFDTNMEWSTNRRFKMPNLVGGFLDSIRPSAMFDLVGVGGTVHGFELTRFTAFDEPSVITLKEPLWFPNGVLLQVGILPGAQPETRLQAVSHSVLFQHGIGQHPEA